MTMSASAATAHRPATKAAAAPPAQLALEGLPTPLAQVRVAVVGYLKRHAELRVSTDGRSHLAVQVLQPHDGLSFVAIFHADAGEPRADLEHLAGQMHPGTAVVITGNGLQLELYEGHQVLRILKCDGLGIAPAVKFFSAGAVAPSPIA